MIVPPNRVSPALEIRPVGGYKTPLVVALYKTLPDFDRPLLTGYFLRLSALFGQPAPKNRRTPSKPNS